MFKKNLHTTMKSIQIILPVLLLATCQPQLERVLNIVPLPNHYEFKKGTFMLSGETVLIAGNTEVQAVTRFLAEALETNNQIFTRQGNQDHGSPRTYQ
jgi:hypothetical protein